jgi:glycosyltransferase involved in cell wall biosynthesis
MRTPDPAATPDPSPATQRDTTPAISVLLPAYNAGRTVELAVQSVLDQTDGDFELLVMDDGSTDDTAECLATIDDPRLVVVRDGANRGLTIRLNELLERARGRYVARMDADDVAFPQRFALQRAALEERELDIVGGGVIVVDDELQPKGVRRIPLTHEEICARPWAGFYLPHPTWFARTDSLRRHGYRPFRLCEDQELLLRANRSLRYGNVHDVVLAYREPDPSWRKIKQGRQSYVAAIRANAATSDRNVTLAVAEQYVKLAVDRFSLATGLADRLLAHRRGAPDTQAFAAWAEVRARLETKVEERRQAPRPGPAATTDPGRTVAAGVESVRSITDHLGETARSSDRRPVMH